MANKKDIINQYQEKINLLKKHSKFYFEKDSPKITDSEFDKLKQDIAKLENKNKFLKNKKDKTNGTIDFISGQRGFLSRSIYNIVPKERDLIIFPNYLMHTAYPFNINAERRSFSFNAKIILNR